MTTTPLLALFAQMAETYPDQPAIIDGDRLMTYAELDRRGTVLAEVLREMSGGQPMGLVMPRSLESVLAGVAAAKSGVVYAPLNPDWPEERLKLIADRCGLKLIMHSGDISSAGKWSADLVKVDVSSFSQSPEPETALAGQWDFTDPHPLYIMHTSGSTGAPKGALISHQGIHAVFHTVQRLGYLAGRRLNHAASLTFDMSIMEMWGALLNGCSLIITATATMLDSRLLQAHIQRYAIDLLLTPTSVFNVLTAQDPSAFRHVKDICFGGEMPSREAVVKVLRACPDLHLHNCYGPTECSVVTAAGRLTEDGLTAKQLPTGKAVGNADLMVVDDNLRLLPPNEEGELAIAGLCVGLGYVHGQTGGRDPFVNLPLTGKRAYLTGDRARLDENGVLYILGRRDDQIKISGYRIEPGEVCETLRQCPAVRAAHVAGFKEPEACLAAYVVPRDKEDGDQDLLKNIRAFAASRLPAYMIPGHFFILEDLPLSPSGKVDLNKLPRPNFKGGTEGDRLLSIFRQVLGHSAFDYGSSFLEAGGSSLMAARLVAALRREFGIAVPYHLIMQPQTADLVRVFIAGPEHGSRPAVLPGGERVVIPADTVTMRI
jgi:amino acid adenylation domain-containing protein